MSDDESSASVSESGSDVETESDIEQQEESPVKESGKAEKTVAKDTKTDEGKEGSSKESADVKDAEVKAKLAAEGKSVTEKKTMKDAAAAKEKDIKTDADGKKKAPSIPEAAPESTAEAKPEAKADAKTDVAKVPDPKSNATPEPKTEKLVVGGVDISQITDQDRLHTLLEQCDNFDERRKIRGRLMTLMEETRARREQATRRRVQHQQQRDSGCVTVSGESSTPIATNSVSSRASEASMPSGAGPLRAGEADASRLVPYVYDQLRSSLSQSPQPPGVTAAAADSGTESGGDDVTLGVFSAGGDGELSVFMDGLQTSLSNSDLHAQMQAAQGSSPQLVADVVSALDKLRASLAPERAGAPQSPEMAEVRRLVTDVARPGELVTLIDRLQSSLESIKSPPVVTPDVNSKPEATPTVAVCAKPPEAKRPPVPATPRKFRPQFRRPHTVGITREEFSEIRRSLDQAVAARSQSQSPSIGSNDSSVVAPFTPSDAPRPARRLSVGSSSSDQSPSSHPKPLPRKKVESSSDHTWKPAAVPRPPPPSWQPPPLPTSPDAPKLCPPEKSKPPPTTTGPTVNSNPAQVPVGPSRSVRPGWKRPSRFNRRPVRPHSIGSCVEDFATIQQALAEAENSESVAARSQSGSMDHVAALNQKPLPLQRTEINIPISPAPFLAKLTPLAPRGFEPKANESGHTRQFTSISRKISHPLERQAAIERVSLDGAVSPDVSQHQAVFHESSRQFANKQGSQISYRDSPDSKTTAVPTPVAVVPPRPSGFGSRTSLDSFLTKQMTKEYLEDSRRVSKEQVIGSRIFTHQRALSEKSNPPEPPLEYHNVETADKFRVVSPPITVPLQPAEQPQYKQPLPVKPRKPPITRYHSIETTEPTHAYDGSVADIHSSIAKSSITQPAPAMSAAVSVARQSQIPPSAASEGSSQLPWVKQRAPWSPRRSSFSRQSGVSERSASPAATALPWSRASPQRAPVPLKPAVAKERHPWHQQRQSSLPPNSSLDEELGLDSDWREKVRQQRQEEQMRHEQRLREEEERKQREKEQEAINNKKRMQAEYQQQQERLQQQQLRLQEQQEALRQQQEQLRREQEQFEQQELEQRRDTFRLEQVQQLELQRQQQYQQQLQQQQHHRQQPVQYQQQQQPVQQSDQLVHQHSHELLQQHGQQIQQRQQQSQVHEALPAVETGWRQSITAREPSNQVIVPASEITKLRAPWSPRAARRGDSGSSLTNEIGAIESVPRSGTPTPQELGGLPRTSFSPGGTPQRSLPSMRSLPGGMLTSLVQSTQLVSTRSQVTRQASEPVKPVDPRTFRPPPLPKTRFGTDGTVSTPVLSHASAPQLSRGRMPRFPTGPGSLPGSPQTARRGHPARLSSGGVLRSCSSDAVPNTEAYDDGNETAESKSSVSASKTSSKSVTSSSRSLLAKGKQAVSPFDKFKQLDAANPKSNIPRNDSNTSDSSGGFKLDPNLAAKAMGAKEMTLYWVQNRLRDYQNVSVQNFSTSWNDGMAFCALIHHFYPDAFDYDKLEPKNRRYNFDLAFKMAEEKAGIYPLLDTDDMVMMKKPDWKCVFTYVQAIYRRLKDGP